MPEPKKFIFSQRDISKANDDNSTSKLKPEEFKKDVEKYHQHEEKSIIKFSDQIEKFLSGLKSAIASRKEKTKPETEQDNTHRPKKLSL